MIRPMPTMESDGCRPPCPGHADQLSRRMVSGLRRPQESVAALVRKERIACSLLALRLSRGSANRHLGAALVRDALYLVSFREFGPRGIGGTIGLGVPWAETDPEAHARCRGGSAE
jgi:hypothetical protein